VEDAQDNHVLGLHIILEYVASRAEGNDEFAQALWDRAASFRKFA